MDKNSNINNVQLVILAAGKGTRMRSNDPKALTLLHGKPFLQHILDNITPLNLTLKPVIVIGHEKEKVKKMLGEKYTYAEQNEQLGTGHALMCAKPAMDKNHEIILVLFTDQPAVSKETLKELIAKHSQMKGVITMATITVPDYKDWRFGMNH